MSSAPGSAVPKTATDLRKNSVVAIAATFSEQVLDLSMRCNHRIRSRQKGNSCPHLLCCGNAKFSPEDIGR